MEDVQRRLHSLGYDLGSQGIDGRFGDGTAAAVAAFRADEGLPAGEAVDDATWAALVDATFKLGDRTLFLKLPYFHGHDVREMQTALNVLGFGSSKADGIFGADTEAALREFQLNVGIPSDGIAGSWTFDAINRLQHVWKGRDATPHVAAGDGGFSRAADVLEQTDVCFWGGDAVSRDIANRIANLALATTPESRVTSADICQGAPSPKALLVEIAYSGSSALPGTPQVAYVDGPVLATRLHTAITSSRTDPPRICVCLGCDASEEATVRIKQTFTVGLLDALCTACGQ